MTQEAANALPVARGVYALLFSDDSTLFFALRMRALLHSQTPEMQVHMVWLADDNALSYRQMTQLLPEGPDRVIHKKDDIGHLLHDPSVAAILTSRVFRSLGDALKGRVARLRKDRACVIAFLGGLDFTPHLGYERRRNCDGVYVFPSGEVETYKAMAADWDTCWQDVGFGHPAFLRPDPALAPDLSLRRDVYFFTQALSPTTRAGRTHMLRAMAAIARANPDRTVWIKLRHLPHENQKHLHKEKHDYPSLMEALQDPPENLKMTACTMDEALENAALGITCTSTAAVDVIRAGVPAMVHLDYVDNYRDPLAPPMEKLFADSGLITGLEDMLHLRASPPNPEWLDRMFCDRDLAARIQQTVADFQTRPFQVVPREMDPTYRHLSAD